MSTLERSREFFGELRANVGAARFVEPYPELAVHLVLPAERIGVQVADGTADGVDGNANVGLWDLELEGAEDVFQSIFDGERTLGEAIYAGLVFVPEEKSKHNLVAALGQAIRAAQLRSRCTAPPATSGRTP